MPPFWLIGIIARTGLAQRFQKAAAWIVAALFFALVVGLMIFGFRSWLHGREQDAVITDRQDLSIDAANRVMAADRAAAVNQQDREDDFRNTQDDAKEAVNEAQRNRTSPLDAAFNKLR